MTFWNKTNFLKNSAYRSFLASPYLSVLIILTGTVLRLKMAFSPFGFWSDEMDSLYITTKPLQEALGRLNAPPLFHLFLRGWAFLVPHTEQALRLLPALFSILTLIYCARSISRGSALLLALSPFSIAFAGELKYNSLLELTSVLFLAQAVKWLENSESENNSRRNLLLFVTGMLAVATHYLALFEVTAVLIVITFTVFFSKKTSVRTKTILSGFLLATPLAGYMVLRTLIDYVSLGWLFKPQPIDVTSFFSRLTELFMPSAFHLFPWPHIVLALTVLFLIYKKDIRIFIFSVLALIYFLFIQYIQLWIFHDRFLIPLYVIFIFSVSHVLTYKKIKWQSVSVVLFLAVLTFNLDFLPATFVTEKSGWKQAAQDLCVDQPRRPLMVISKSSAVYYFPGNCAFINSTRVIRPYLHHTGYAVYTASTHQKVLDVEIMLGIKYQFRKIKDYEGSKEPISLYEYSDEGF